MSWLAGIILDGRNTLYSGFYLLVDTQVLMAVDSKVAGCFAKVAGIAASALKFVYTDEQHRAGTLSIKGNKYQV